MKFVTAVKSLNICRFRPNIVALRRHYFHKNTTKRLGAIKKPEDNRAASFSLSMTSEKHRSFAFMTSVYSGRLFEHVILQRREK